VAETFVSLVRQLNSSTLILRWCAGLSLLLSTAVGCRPVQASNVVGGRSSGSLFIVGGGSQPESLVSRFVALAGGRSGRIAVLPMASGSAEESGREKAEQLRSHGAQATVVNVGGAAANSDSVVALLSGVTGVWFTGGDQSRLVSAIGGSRVLEAIRARHRAGAVIGGTSAGAAIMSDSMITGDQRRPDSTGYYGDNFPDIARGTIVVTSGFGFLPHAIVDQHFVRRERHNRLLSAVLERPAMLGVGIDEGTALIVRPDGKWEVDGRSVAVVVDARKARITDGGVLGASGLQVHVLPAGSIFDPRTGAVALP
jgi:cyanophycinase